MSTATMEYNKLKLFVTDYNFKNEKESDKFFDNALIQGSAIYMKDLERSMDERIHVAFSRSTVSNIAAIALLVLTAAGISASATIFGAVMLGLSIASKIAGGLFKSKMEDLAMAKEFTLGMFYSDNLDSLEGIRRDLIKGKI